MGLNDSTSDRLTGRIEVVVEVEMVKMPSERSNLWVHWCGLRTQVTGDAHYVLRSSLFVVFCG